MKLHVSDVYGCLYTSTPTQIQIQVFGMVVTNLLAQNEEIKCQYRTQLRTG